MFVTSDDVIENLSSSLFDKDQLHLIGAFDIRVLNLDRNDCNILVKKETNGFKLIPIDHGLCLPESLEVNALDLNFTSWA